jgi:hypothetical protein
MNEPGKQLQHQTTEIEMTLGAILVRTDLDQNSVTVGFRPWFEWDVDTRQVEVQTGVIHFIQPDNSIIGLRVDQSATTLAPHCFEGGRHNWTEKQLEADSSMKAPEGEGT